MNPIIDSQDLRYAYVSEKGEYNFALNGVNISVQEGEFVVVLGRNGSGKSTFARLVNALMMPTEGKVYVDGMDTSVESNALDVRKTAGMVFQNPDNQLVATVVEEDIAFGPENLGVPREEIIRRIDFALETVNMGEFRHHAPHMLSGGQKQRIAIAGVLAMIPKIIVFDEATAMLDPQGRRDILDIIHKLNKERGMTIVLITHYMEEAIDADKVIVMQDGFVQKEGRPEEIFFDGALVKKAGLVSPFAARLSMDLQAAGIFLQSKLRTWELLEELCPLQ